MEEREFTDRLLAGGDMLVYLKHRFLTKRTAEQRTWFYGCLRDSLLLVPTLPVSGAPDRLEDETGKKYLPVFSQERQMPPDYASEFILRTLSFADCLAFARSFPDISAIELDGFSEPFTIDYEMADAILRSPSRRGEEEPQNKG